MKSVDVDAVIEQSIREIEKLEHALNASALVIRTQAAAIVGLRMQVQELGAEPCA